MDLPNTRPGEPATSAAVSDAQQAAQARVEIWRRMQAYSADEAYTLPVTRIPEAQRLAQAEIDALGQRVRAYTARGDRQAVEALLSGAQQAAAARVQAFRAASAAAAASGPVHTAVAVSDARHEAEARVRDNRERTAVLADRAQRRVADPLVSGTRQSAEAHAQTARRVRSGAVSPEHAVTLGDVPEAQLALRAPVEDSPKRDSVTAVPEVRAAATGIPAVRRPVRARALHFAVRPNMLPPWMEDPVNADMTVPRELVVGTPNRDGTDADGAIDTFLLQRRQGPVPYFTAPQRRNWESQRGTDMRVGMWRREQSIVWPAVVRHTEFEVDHEENAWQEVLRRSREVQENEDWPAKRPRSSAVDDFEEGSHCRPTALLDRSFLKRLAGSSAAAHPPQNFNSSRHTREYEHKATQAWTQHWHMLPNGCLQLERFLIIKGQLFLTHEPQRSQPTVSPRTRIDLPPSLAIFPYIELEQSLRDHDVEVASLKACIDAHTPNTHAAAHTLLNIDYALVHASRQVPSYAELDLPQKLVLLRQEQEQERVSREGLTFVTIASITASGLPDGRQDFGFAPGDSWWQTQAVLKYMTQYWEACGACGAVATDDYARKDYTKWLFQLNADVVDKVAWPLYTGEDYGSLRKRMREEGTLSVLMWPKGLWEASMRARGEVVPQEMKDAYDEEVNWDDGTGWGSIIEGIIVNGDVNVDMIDASSEDPKRDDWTASGWTVWGPIDAWGPIDEISLGGDVNADMIDADVAERTEMDSERLSGRKRRMSDDGVTTSAPTKRTKPQGRKESGCELPPTFLF
ncbi:hypothetical protein LTR91_017591 [Friedmanniomyces endolithicus]|uniref:Uncharacterized protein n=1 Tax=Friedmanniomyces endolithicus TaxID=329885 RepID=A0AAN6K5T5_9PEZI|nr:hypothetical protein LTR94_016683 [Friedmanniomyces endolithicus]KAK0775117.1 hypothetical protein LTR59_014642 [Friedmanniomyces endolithicus]KAK0780662.1 hypothetical protein LTR38_014001 [Friedmanniomyces endolithicus]KAK0852878.1 hypothetical protein LTS02_012199 [Friedmanniomyces endolithicus]KAK0867505.1 hypothetical protein LTR87_014556 [Friedmanniomyces endolithicus]